MRRFAGTSQKTVRIHVDSKHRHNPQITGNGDFTIPLNRSLAGVIQSQLISASIPTGFHQIDAHTDKLYIKEGDDPTLVVIDLFGYHGTYSVDDLCELLDNRGLAANHNGHNTYSFEYDPNIKKITISRADGDIYDFSPRITEETKESDLLATEILGFVIEGRLAEGESTPTTYEHGAGPFVAGNVYNGTAGIHTIYVICPQLYDESNFTSSTEQLMRGCVGMIPIDYANDLQHYTPNPQTQVTFSFRTPRRIEELSIQMVARIAEHTWKIVNFRGHHVMLDFRVVQQNEI